MKNSSASTSLSAKVDRDLVIEKRSYINRMDWKTGIRRESL